MSDDVKQMMLEDSTDLLDNVEVSTIAEQCQKLKALEDVDDEVRQIAPKELSAPDLFEDDEDLDEESNDEK